MSVEKHRADNRPGSGVVSPESVPVKSHPNKTERRTSAVESIAIVTVIAHTKAAKTLRHGAADVGAVHGGWLHCRT